MAIDTLRLRLRAWRAADRDAFARMHADPDVMHDYGGPISRPESDAKLARYMDCQHRLGFSRWAIESRSGAFLGYAGVMPAPDDHPVAPAFQIGWRLIRAAWGHGYATEAAHASLVDIFARERLHEVMAFTAQDNSRSQAVMGRLALRRDESRDFVAQYDGLGAWRGLVWIAEPSMFTPGQTDP